MDASVNVNVTDLRLEGWVTCPHCKEEHKFNDFVDSNSGSDEIDEQTYVVVDCKCKGRIELFLTMQAVVESEFVVPKHGFADVSPGPNQIDLFTGETVESC